MKEFGPHNLLAPVTGGELVRCCAGWGCILTLLAACTGCVALAAGLIF